MKRSSFAFSAFGLFQCALGVSLVAAGPIFGGPAWLLLWPGWSVFVVGLGYLGLGPRVFGKRRIDGALPLPLVVFLFPYLAVAWVLWQIKSRIPGEPAWHEIAPGVALGRRPLSVAELPPGTRCVIDLTAEFSRAVPAAIAPRYLCVPTLDTSVASDAELRALLDAIETEEGPIYVHCAMGRGRSAMIAAAILLRRGIANDVDDAVSRLRQVRPSVRLHPVQHAALSRLFAKIARLESDDPPQDRADRPSRAPSARARADA
jgi:hypothetical protein